MRLEFFVLCLLAASSVFGEIITDNFESGSLDKLEWSTYGDTDWYVDAAGIEGSLCMRSGQLAVGQSSTVEITVNTNRVRFFATRYTMSGDSIKFYIDGKETYFPYGSVNEWPAMSADVELEYGEHNFKWVCARGNGWYDSTALYIDNISFGMDLPGNGTVDQPYEISTAQQFCSIKPESAFYINKHFKLTADVDFTGYGHIEEANEDVELEFNMFNGPYNEFTGTFDGNGHEIANLTYHSSSYPTYQDFALFGKIGETGKIYNLIVRDIDIAGKYTLAGIATANYGTIENCRVYGKINAFGQYGNAASGIVANNFGLVKGCFTKMNIDSVHGLVGGIAGSNTGGKIIDCSSNSTIKVNSGGASGIAKNTGGGLIENCTFVGSIFGYRELGGISSNTQRSTIVNCTTVVQIRGCQVVGGIVGSNYYNSSIIHCKSSGAVGASYGHAGGIAGGNESSLIYGCYSNTNVYKLDVTDNDFENAIYKESGLYASGGVTGINRSIVDMCYADSFVASGSYTFGVSYGISGSTINSFYRVFEDSSYLDDFNTVAALVDSEFENSRSYTDSGWDFNYYWKMNMQDSPRHPEFATSGDDFDISRHLADQDRNGTVDFADLQICLSAWLTKKSKSQNEGFAHLSDINFDGVISLADIVIIASYWLETAPGYQPDLIASYKGVNVPTEPIGFIPTMTVTDKTTVRFSYEIENIGLAYMRSNMQDSARYYLLASKDLHNTNWNEPFVFLSDPGVIVLESGTIDHDMNVNQVHDVTIHQAADFGFGQYFIRLVVWPYSAYDGFDSNASNNVSSPVVMNIEPETEMTWIYVDDDGSGMQEFDHPLNLNWKHYVDDPQSFTGYMSKYETTNAQYCKFLNAALIDRRIIVGDDGIVYGDGGLYAGIALYETYAANVMSQIVYENYTFSVRSRDGMTMYYHPVNCVTYEGAMAFCNYYGYSLPTTMQWQAVADYDGSYIYACAIVDQTELPTELANFNNNNPLGLSSEPYTVPVDYYDNYSFGYGLACMTANVAERCLNDGSRSGYWGRTNGNHWLTVDHTVFSYQPVEYFGFRAVKFN